MKKILLAAAAAASIATGSTAATVNVGTDEGLVSQGRDNQGWWSNTATNTNNSNDNYITGALGSQEYRSYFTFDLSGLSGQSVSSATIELRRYNQSSNPTLEFFDVSASATDLARRSVSDPVIFADLGTGNSYGSFTPKAGNPKDVLSFVLNDAALKDINASLGGYFSVGAKATGGLIFSSSGSEPGNGGPGYTQQLVLNTGPGITPAPVPVPATALLLFTGVGGIAALRRRAK